MSEQGFARTQVAESLGCTTGLDVVATAFVERVRLVDGHMRARAILDLTGCVEVTLPDGSKVAMKRKADGSVCGVDGRGKQIVLML